MMARTQITLDPETQCQARERAAKLGVSFAEYIRRLVAKDLDSPEQRCDPSAVFNLGNSGEADIAGAKAAMLGDAAEAMRDKGN